MGVVKTQTFQFLTKPNIEGIDWCIIREEYGRAWEKFILIMMCIDPELRCG